MPIIKSPFGDYEVDAYEPKHYPENQNWYQGFPLNPTLRDHFDNTPNEQREQKEIDDWWGLPYIELETWEQREQHSRRVQAQHRAEQNEFVLSDEALEQKIADERVRWHEAWPSGTRYDVRCLDGGAWDRSLGWGMVATLDAAVELCRNGPQWRRPAPPASQKGTRPMNKQNQAAQVIAARLRECREAKGWTLAAAAARLSEAAGETVLLQRWLQWEQGDRVPASELAGALAVLFGTDPGYFAEPTE